jgi:lysozyme
MMNIKNILPKGRKASLVTAAVLTLATPFIAREEGLRTSAYLDSVGVPTICYGETEGVKMGDSKTKQECDALFNTRLGVFAVAVDSMIEPEMPAEVHAALTSWAYNVGLGAARKSTLVKRANYGDFVGACNELLKWRFAGGKPILQKRRERERQLCLRGLNRL